MTGSTTDHALVAPSAAEQWMHCAPSARLQRILGIGESKYTREGRLAHKVAAAALTLKTCAPFRAPYAEEIMKQAHVFGVQSH